MDAKLQKELDSMNMSLEDILREVERICRAHGVEHLYLFGSYAAGNPTATSDIDVVIKGGHDLDTLREEIDEIMTLKKIDLFVYDEIGNKELRDEIDQYARKIY